MDFDLIMYKRHFTEEWALYEMFQNLSGFP